MSTMKEAAESFLALNSIAVAGVSRSRKRAANLIYSKLRSEGYKVFAINPNTARIEGDVCFADLKSLPVLPDGVVIVTKPSITNNIVKECADLGIHNVWIHEGVDSKATSVSAEVINFCRQNNICVIPGGCPMMFCRHADIGHRIMHWIQKLRGKLPTEV